MKKVLIVSLRKYGDVLTSGHIINSLKQNYLDCEITLLVYKESLAVTQVMKGIKEVVSIDRKKLLSIKNAPLFSDFSALDLFGKQISSLKNTHWDIVLNHSNDTVSTYLSSFFFSKEKAGVTFKNDGSTSYNSDWAIVLNDIIPTQERASFNLTEIYHRLLEIPFEDSGSKLVAFPSNNRSVLETFKGLKDGNDGAKVIGIQVTASTEDKALTRETIEQYCKYCLATESFVPILMIAAIEKERIIAKAISEKFDGAVTIVETDFKALPSVLLHLDLLVTPDTSVKHMADLAYTPLIEISLDNSPFLRQSSIEDSNIVIRPKEGRNTHLNVIDLVKATHIVLGDDPVDLNFSAEVEVATTKINAGKIAYQPLTKPTTTELRRFFSRIYIEDHIAGQDFNFSLAQANEFSKEVILDFVKKEKEATLLVLRSLLATIRSISQFEQDKKTLYTFTEKLDDLLSFIETSHASSLPVKFFKAKLETLRFQKSEDSILFMRNELFELKNKIQSISRSLDQLGEIQEEKYQYL